ncbi:hypothetical protein [Pantoea agglomerans]|uniref:hypothetical protein n=1 Tax=Enterobacter agglomerans TaxID=549 RepID=UPI001654231E|nr:hypothetical protein [Pantoea agglomerans]
MKNTLYDFNGLYLLVRRYYLKCFPHIADSAPEAILNLQLKCHDSSALVVSTGQLGNTLLENQEPIQKHNPPYVENHGYVLEAYLSDEASRGDILEDIKALNEWMIKEGFIHADDEGSIATSRLLDVRSLTS